MYAHVCGGPLVLGTDLDSRSRLRRPDPPTHLQRRSPVLFLLAGRARARVDLSHPGVTRKR